MSTNVDFTKEDFVIEMDKLRNICDNINDAFDTIEPIMGTCDNLYSLIFDGIEFSIETLRRLVNDSGDWIHWYIYETEWGTNGLCYVVDEKPMYIETYEQLWDVIKGNI